MSYDLLSEQQQALFRQIAVVPGPTFDARLAAAAAGAENSRKVESTIDQLVDRGLVELASTEGHYRLHDLLRISGRRKPRRMVLPTKATLLSRESSRMCIEI